MKNIIIAFIVMLSSHLLAKTIDEQKEECIGAGFEWNESLNACKQTQEAVELKEEHDKCAESDDQDACYAQVAEEKTGVKKGDGTKQKQKGAMLARTAAGAYSLFTSFSGGGFSLGPCMSKKIFSGTTGAWTVGDLFLKKEVKKSFKDLKERYDNEAKNQEKKGGEAGSYQAQIRAFVYLKEEQELVKQHADKRIKLQMAVTAGYGVSLGLAVIESIPKAFPTLIPCPGGGKSESKLLKTGSSQQIAVASGIMTAASFTMIKGAKKQKKEAEENIQKIDEMLETFANQMAGYCPDGREELNDPRCYCYGDDGKKNEDRTNSAMCQNLWAEDQNNFTVAETDYSVGTQAPEVCLTASGKIDEKCHCRKLINSKTKENACHKNPIAFAGTQNFAGSIGAANALTPLNKISQGANLGIGSIDKTSAQKAIAKSTKFLSNLTNQAHKAGVKVPTAADFEKRANTLSLKAATPKALASFQNSTGSGRSFATRPLAVQEAIKKEENEEAPSVSKILKATGKVRAINGKKKAFKFNWGDSSGGGGAQVKNIVDQSHPNKSFNLKGSDITHKKDKNIFGIISRRYQVSGLKHLFADE